MTKALWLSHTAEKGGAELFMIDVLSGAASDWDAIFLNEGPVAQTLRQAGRGGHVVRADRSLLGVRRGASPLRAGVGLLGALGVARQVAKRLADYDVLFANSQKALVVGAMAGRIARKPVVWVLHDILTDRSFSASTRRSGVMVANAVCAAVVMVSKAVGDAFVEVGGRRDLLRLVYNGFDVDKPPPPAADVRGLFGFDQRPVVGVFSRLSAWKGQHVLLEALTVTPNVQALVVGGALFGQESYEAHLHAEAKRLKIEDRVRFVGFRDDVAALMRGVDVVVHASTHPEPGGRVVAEGMLSGKPVIASSGGGMAEVVESGRTGLLVPRGDAGALAEAINQLLADPFMAGEMATAAVREARERFDLRITCADLAAIASEARGGRLGA